MRMYYVAYLDKNDNKRYVGPMLLESALKYVQTLALFDYKAWVEKEAWASAYHIEVKEK